MVEDFAPAPAVSARRGLSDAEGAAIASYLAVRPATRCPFGALAFDWRKGIEDEERGIAAQNRVAMEQSRRERAVRRGGRR
jgi:hypothetical protein